MKLKTVASFVVSLFLLALPISLSAQEVASMTGVVTDKTGAVVPDVNVTLVDTRTNTTYQSKTNSTGAYTFVKLAPGPGYKISFARDGFETLTITDVYVAVGATHTQNAQLQVGKLTESVEVTGVAQGVTLDTTDATIGNNFDMRSVHELPVQFRDSVAGLLTLQPGVVDSAGVDDPNNSRAGAVTGSRIDQGNITLDGIDVNDFATGQAFVATANAPVDSIQEFRGETANPLAASGRGSGAQIQLSTKSGTNQWHGSLSEYHRNTLTEANDFFNIRSDVPRTQLIRNQFGGTIGGPIKKDKFFFFFNYNGRRDAQGDTTLRTVPLDNFRNGTLGYINNNTTDPVSGAPCSRLSRINTTPGCVSFADPTALAAIDPLHVGPDAALLSFINGRYPHANDLTQGDGLNTGGFRFNSPTHLTENNYITRLDYNLTNTQRLFGKFSIIGEKTGDNVNGATVQFPGDPVTKFIVDTSYVYTVGHTWTITPTKVNQFVYGQSRSRLNFPTHFNPVGANDFLIVANNGQGFPTLSSPFERQDTQRRDIPIHTFRDDFSYLRGTHNIQIGGTFKPITALSNEVLDLNEITLGLGGNLFGLDPTLEPIDIRPASATAANDWDRMFAFILGRYGAVTQNVNYNTNLQPTPQDGGSIRKYRYYETEVYLQDTWRARNDLTLTYGLRWQYYSVPYEINGFEAIPNVGLNTFFSQRVAAAEQGITGNNTIPFVVYSKGGKANHGSGFYHPDWRDFAPRLSFAYNPPSRDGFLGRLFGDRKTVIRGGAGIIFDHPGTEALNFEQNRNSYLFTTSTNTPYGTGVGSVDLANDPRFQSPLALPPGLNPAQQPTNPFIPFVDPATGIAFGEANGQTFNYAFDPNLKTPYNITYSFGIQRELPGNFIVDVNYFARLGRRLLIQSDGGQIINFKDPASGQLLAGAFAALSQQVRTAVPDPNTGLITVSPQPFFENQVFPGATAAIANSSLQGLVTRGDLSDTVQALNAFGLLAPGIGLSPQFDTNVYVTNQSFSSYNGLLATVRKKLSRNLQFDLNYTYSHSIDNASTSANSFFTDFVCDITNLRVCKGDSDFDVRHLVTLNGIYDLPIGRGKWIGGNASGWVNQLIGGWRVAGINTWRTGFAFRTHSSAFPIGFANDVPGIFDGDMAAIKTDIHTDPNTGEVQFFADPVKANGAFRGPLGLEAGQRNNLHGPHLSNTDLSVIKDFKAERFTIQFRADAFNAFNHTNFALPTANAMDISGATGVDFGTISSTSTSPRVMQFALRIDF